MRPSGKNLYQVLRSASLPNDMDEEQINKFIRSLRDRATNVSQEVQHTSNNMLCVFRLYLMENLRLTNLLKQCIEQLESAYCDTGEKWAKRTFDLVAQIEESINEPKKVEKRSTAKVPAGSKMREDRQPAGDDS